MEKRKERKIQETRPVCLKKGAEYATMYESEGAPHRGGAKRSSLYLEGRLMKFLTDMHTHSYPASHDAQNSLKEMLAAAQAKGIAFYGVSNHFDYDYDLLQMGEKERAEILNGDEEEYFHEARHLQEAYEGVMNVAVGAEFGYSRKPSVGGRYAATYEKYRPDYVINSVHGGEGKDFARYQFTEGEEETYEMYLRLIRDSLDAPYPYDIVGHIEYLVRYVPFQNRQIDVDKYASLIDDILLTVIAKDKILEVNTATKGLPRLSLPSVDFLKRYFALGGRKISYGSDAHGVARIGEKREEVVAALKEIGFTYLTLPFRGEHIKVEI